MKSQGVSFLRVEGMEGGSALDPLKRLRVTEGPGMQLMKKK